MGYVRGRIVLTNEELDIIRRFISLLDNPGVKGLLTLSVAETYHNEYNVNDVLGAAIRDLVSTCKSQDGLVHDPQNVTNAAPSLYLVARHAARLSRHSGYEFPSDFLPTDELLRKCLDKFYADVRSRAREQGSETSD
jgi:hypothetical protein